jgi:UDPglucose 6-dehydrogenase
VHEGNGSGNHGNGANGSARIAVVGCGHVGLVMAAGLAHLGHRVVGVDKSSARVEQLVAGTVPIHEPDLDFLLADGMANERLSFTTSYEAVENSDFIFLAVDTPKTLAGAADLRNIRSATRSIANAMNGASPIIINKSTSPIGTGETIEGLIAEALVEHNKQPRIVSNPEFLRQGRAVWDFFHPDRIVVGARIAEDARAVAGLYEGLGGEVIVTDMRTAEMIKYVANSYLATRVSFINEIARLCEHIGVDIDIVIDGISQDPRIGRQFLQPGVGFGGSCLPKDVAALSYIGDTLGVATPILSAVQEVNQSQRTSAVRRLRARLGSLENRTIGVWGLTFKAGTEDTRESPALDIVDLALNEGARIQAFDPAVARFPDGAREDLRPLLRETALDAARGADALAVLTDWPEFRDISPLELRAVMAGSVVFDGRNLLDRATFEEAGFAYLGVGRIARRPNRRHTDT